ncbi:pre-mRNA-splicing factor cwc22, partial [Coemansia aciculifera]
ETTTSSSRIFLKIMLQDMAEELGMKTLNDRLKSTEYKVSEAVKGMFPSTNASAMRFAINYYTSIGLGAVTEEMREQLKALPLLTTGDSSDSDSGSDSGSGSSSSGSYTSSSSGSGSETESSSGSESGSSRSRSPRRASGRRQSRSPPKQLADEEAPLTKSPSERPPVIASPTNVSIPVRDSHSRSPKPDNMPEARRQRVRSPSYSPAASSRALTPERSTSRSRAAGRSNRSPSPPRKRYRSRSPSTGIAERE